MPSEDTEIFRLKVSEIVHSILRDRDLTVKEVQKIKDAIQASLELILSQHENKNQEVYQKIAREECKTAIEVFDKKLQERRTKEVEEERNKTHKQIGLAVGVCGVVIAIIQIILRVLGI